MSDDFPIDAPPLCGDRHVSGELCNRERGHPGMHQSMQLAYTFGWGTPRDLDYLNDPVSPSPSQQQDNT